MSYLNLPQSKPWESGREAYLFDTFSILNRSKETYATVDKLMLLDHYNGFCRVEGWCCTNQLICNTDFYYKKKQNQFKIHFKPNQHAKFQRATTQVLCSTLVGQLLRDTLGPEELEPSEALAVLVFFSAVILTSSIASYCQSYF